MSGMSAPLRGHVAFKAWQARKLVLEMCRARGQGYAGQGLELADVLATLYHAVMRGDAGRRSDRFVLSTGHSAIALYATLGTLGVYSREQLLTYGGDGSEIEESPLEDMPGFEITGGSLGQGPSQAVGIALGERLQGRDAHVFCEVSDGELQEGAVWEAFMYAGSKQVSNLTFIVDLNGEQADGATADILDLEPLEQRLAGFGLDLHRVDGHDLDALYVALCAARAHGPSIVICETVPGSGVPSLERYDKVHYVRADPDTWEKALHELDASRPVNGARSDA